MYQGQKRGFSIFEQEVSTMSDQRKLPSKQIGFQALERSVKERIYNMEPGFSF